ncbi:hypothetical protein [Marinobacter sp. MMG032]|uniref:PIN domain-containing protein n=1 Tax=Marinobacter sp. MMG032 TaxID=3158548 RepID=A0AAU7MTF3_9GAMM|nr:hypothetical protein [Gammaproteobacteria bacterium]|tara:strand:- start:4393 stop:7743 length:3351 start_codon:yes stop_codon:yes gene_type:complete
MIEREPHTSSGCQAQVTQEHKGQGDNVAGDKIYSPGISVDDIEGSVVQILVFIRHRITDSAEAAVEALEGSSRLEGEARKLLELIKILTDFAVGKDTKASFKKLNELRTGCKSTFAKDLANATLIRAIATRDSPDFSGIRIPLEEEFLSKEAYLEYVADIDRLSEEAERTRFEFSEPVLCGLIRGLLRVGEPEVAEELSDHLVDQYDSVNSKTINIACRIQSFFKTEGVQNFWTLNHDNYQILLGICNEIIDLINFTEGKEHRLFIWSANLLEFSAGEISDLLDICTDFIATIEKTTPNIAKAIRGFNSGNFDYSDGLPFLIGKCERDEIFRRNKVSEILKSNYISIDESAILLNVGDKEKIKEWINSGGGVTEDSALLKDFVELELHAFVLESNPKERLQLREKSDRFLDDHKDSLKDINPFRIHALCHHLLKANLSTPACKILSHFIPTGNLWLSPLVELYLHALLHSTQLDTLSVTLDRIPKKYWNYNVWRIEAKKQETLNHLPDAVGAIKNALHFKPTSIESWFNLIYLNRRQGADDSQIAGILDLISTDILDKPSENAARLLSEFLAQGHVELMETKLIKWFLEDPEGSARLITDFHLSVIEMKGQNLDLRDTVDDCVLAVSYTVDGEQQLKLIVKNPEYKHSAFIDSRTPLGDALLNSSKGSKFNIGMSEYEVNEFLPPYVGVFRISTKIRSSINDGTDSFQSFTMPADPEEFISSIKKKMQFLKKDADPILENSDIPIYMRGKRFDLSNPIKGMIAILFDRKYKNSGIPSFGSENPTEIILDIWSITYIFYSGLSETFRSSGISTIITRETKAIIENWIDDVNRDDYLTIDLTDDGELIRSGSTEIYNGTVDLQEWMKFIIESSEIQSPNSVDLPEEINECRDLIDESVESSIILAFSNDLDWMSIDPFFARLLGGKGGRSVNVSRFSVQLGANREIEAMATAIQLHLFHDFPCSITIEHLIQLAFSQEVAHDEILKDALIRYQDELSCIPNALSIIKKICIANLIGAMRAGEVIDSEGRLKLRHGSGTLSVFYTCCLIASTIQLNDEKLSREERLARFFLELFDTIHEMPSLINLVRRAGSVYAKGHFLSITEINSCLGDLQSGAKGE